MSASILALLIVTQAPTETFGAAKESSAFARARAIRQVLISHERARTQSIELGATILETRPSANLIRRASSSGSGALATSEVLLTIAQLRANAAKFQVTKLDTLRVCEATAKAWEDAVAIYEQGAADFEKESTQEPYAQLKDEYLVLAKTWRDWSSKAAAHASKLREENKQLEDFFPFAARVEILLGHFDRHLSSLPPFPNDTEREAAIGRVKDFIRQFEGLRQDIRKLESSDPPDAPPRPPGDDYKSPSPDAPETVAGRNRTLPQPSGGALRRSYAKRVYDARAR